MKGAGIFAWLMYVVVRVALATMQVFPIDWNLRTARYAAHVWRWLMPRHRQRALAHLMAAYPETTCREDLERIADRSMESFAMFAVEAACLPRLITPFTWSRYFRLVNHEALVGLMSTGRGVILVAGHYGSFELTGHMLAAMGFPVAAVMRPLDNEYLNRYLVAARRMTGLKLIDKKGAGVEAEAFLAEGGAVGFIGDQDAGRKGLFVDFFGRPASTYKSIGLLAMRTNSPIAVGYSRRIGDRARYDLGVQRLILPEDWADKEDPLLWITEQFTTAIEEIVRVDPGQYLWIHRRWKSQPKSRRRVAAAAAIATK